MVLADAREGAAERRAGAAAPTAVPQALQNLAPAGSWVAQFRHAGAASELPHSAQNLPVDAAPHVGQGVVGTEGLVMDRNWPHTGILYRLPAVLDAGVVFCLSRDCSRAGRAH